MKKILIIMLLIISLAGCNWFKPKTIIVKETTYLEPGAGYSVRPDSTITIRYFHTTACMWADTLKTPVIFSSKHPDTSDYGIRVYYHLLWSDQDDTLHLR
jgi:hypothetical protein